LFVRSLSTEMICCVSFLPDFHICVCVCVCEKGRRESHF
jgi:hypothetical protein